MSLVSVVVPTFNRVGFLKETLRSIAHQTYPSQEIVVVNDGGNDVSLMVSQINAPVHLINHKTNLGPPAALNHGVQNTTTPFLSLCEDDDILHAAHSEELLAALLRLGTDALVYCNVHAFAEHPNATIGLLRRPFDYKTLCTTNYIATCGILFSRALYDEVGGFDESLPNYWDWDFYLKAAKLAPLVHCDIARAYHRIHPDSHQISSNPATRRVQLDRLCERHGLGPLPLKTLYDNFDQE